MAPRRGAEHHYAGPHLPRLPNTTGLASDDLADPANGEAVPRCLSCGLPDHLDNRLLTGVWQVGTFRCAVRLCERCIRRVCPWDPRIGDPLQAA
jgi:hypothetical protein